MREEMQVLMTGAPARHVIGSHVSSLQCDATVQEAILTEHHALLPSLQTAGSGQTK
jgi:hypothetical protein